MNVLVAIAAASFVLLAPTPPPAPKPLPAPANAAVSGNLTVLDAKGASSDAPCASLQVSVEGAGFSRSVSATGMPGNCQYLVSGIPPNAPLRFSIAGSCPLAFAPADWARSARFVGGENAVRNLTVTLRCSPPSPKPVPVASTGSQLLPPLPFEHSLYVSNCGGAGTLYCALDGSQGISVFPTTANGNVAPSRTIAGPATGLLATGALAVDAVGQLYVVNTESGGTCSISVFVMFASGDAPPIRTIWSAQGLLSGCVGAAFDRPGDLAVSASDKILFFAADANGDAKPIRVVSGPSTLLYGAQGIGYGGGGLLFAATRLSRASSSFAIVGFAPDAADNATPAVRLDIGLNYPTGIAFDRLGNLYVANRDAVVVYLAPLGGAAPPARRIAGPATGLSTPVGLAVDSAGSLYVANHGGSITVYAPGANGNVAPIRVIAGDKTRLTGPEYLTLGP